MQTTSRKFQRDFAEMRRKADAGESVTVLDSGRPRYVFKLIKAPRQPSLAELCRDATKGLKLERDRSPLREL